MSQAWIFILAVSGWMAGVGEALAWSEGGHKIVALMAYDRLDARQREQVVGVLRAHPLWHDFFETPMQSALGSTPPPEEAQRWLFAQASVWPDLVRPPKGSPAAANPFREYHHPTWHYIDLPLFRQAEDRKHLGYRLVDPSFEWSPDGVEPKEGWNAVQVLKKARYEWTAKQESPAERAVMLCWLMHLVGDVHQPCHCAELYWPHKLPRGDRGANDLSLWSMGGKSLHVYWDGLFDAHGLKLPEIEQKVVALSKSRPGATPSTSGVAWAPEAWVQEGRSAARDYVYPPALMVAVDGAKPENPSGGGHKVLILRLSEVDLQTYERRAHDCANHQILLAGERLAGALRVLAP